MEELITLHKYFVPSEGIEPPTYCLGRSRSIR
jgi:hypothetical protein